MHLMASELIIVHDALSCVRAVLKCFVNCVTRRASNCKQITLVSGANMAATVFCCLC